MPLLQARRRLSSSHVQRRQLPMTLLLQVQLLRQLLASMEEIVVSDVALNYEHGLIYIFNLPDHPTNCAQVFGAVAQHRINIAMINTSEVSISVVVDRAQGDAAHKALKAAFQLA